VPSRSSLIIYDFLRMTESQTKSELQCRRYVVRGRVQGVGFRFYVERESRDLGVVVSKTARQK
jgi:hypothetical protein